MRILDVRGKDTSHISKIEGQYNPRYYRQISTQTPHETTDADIKEFRERAEKEGAVIIFISNYGQSAYIPIKQVVPAIRPLTPEETTQRVATETRAILNAIREVKPATITLGKHTYKREVIGGYLFYHEGEERYADSTIASLLWHTEEGDRILQQSQPSVAPQTGFSQEDNLLQYYKVPPSAF